jgi:phage terminase large subunit
MSQISVTLPNEWTPRPYQLPVLQYLEGGGDRAVTVWARRHGKDSTAINWTARAAFQRPGLYWHIFPNLRQARRGIWNAIDKQGRRVIEQAFPGALEPGRPGSIVKRIRDDEMLIELVNGSFYQLIGADNHDALVGANPVGVVFSEWSIMDPKTWEFIRPILTENGGWAWFIYTPRGRNHGYDMLKMAEANDRWFAEVVNIEQAGVLDVEAVLAEERASGMPEELIQQEYFCSFDIGNVGTIFDKEISQAEVDGRITSVPYDPNFPVQTAWDLGVRDATAIWFIQHVGFDIRVIDYYEATGEGMPHFINVINSKGYAYGRHIGPHDLEQREWASGNSKRQAAADHGLHFEVAPKLSIADGINAVRSKLPRCFFDKMRTDKGLKALRSYAYEYDEDNKVFRQTPKHNWASHAASAFRYYAVMPDLNFQTPEWLKNMAPDVFDSKFKRNKSGVWTPQKEDQSIFADNYDPLAEFRGELVR